MLLTYIYISAYWDVCHMLHKHIMEITLCQIHWLTLGCSHNFKETDMEQLCKLLVRNHLFCLWGSQATLNSFMWIMCFFSFLAHNNLANWCPLFANLCIHLISRTRCVSYGWITRLAFKSDMILLYARLKNGRIMPWQCPSVRLSVRLSVRPSVRPGFPDFSSTCFEISIWNLVYTFSRWHDMSSLSCTTIGSLWPSLQPKVGQTHFLQSWPHKSR